MTDKDINKPIDESKLMRMPREDFDFDKEFNDSQKETIKKKPKITVYINKDKFKEPVDLEEYVNKQLIDNPDIDPYQIEHELLETFDFEYIKNNYTKEVVLDKNNQYMFSCDCVWFYGAADLFMTTNYLLYVLNGTNSVVKPGIRRFYLILDDRLYAPIFVDGDDIIFDYKLFNLSEAISNEISCYIINNKEKLFDLIDNNDVQRNVKPLKQLYSLSFFIEKSLNESFTLSSNETGCPRCIWIDGSRKTKHASRIKYQHNMSIKHTNGWASIIIDKDAGFPIRNNSNKDISDKEENLIRKFVEINSDLILSIDEQKDGEKIFLANCKKIDKKGNIVNVENVISDDIHSYETIRYIKSADMSLIKKNEKYNIARGRQLLLDKWFNHIEIKQREIICFSFDDYKKYIYNYKFELIDSKSL